MSDPFRAQRAHRNFYSSNATEMEGTLFRLFGMAEKGRELRAEDYEPMAIASSGGSALLR